MQWNLCFAWQLCQKCTPRLNPHICKFGIFISSVMTSGSHMTSMSLVKWVATTKSRRAQPHEPGLRNAQRNAQGMSRNARCLQHVTVRHHPRKSWEDPASRKSADPTGVGVWECFYGNASKHSQEQPHHTDETAAARTSQTATPLMSLEMDA